MGFEVTSRSGVKSILSPETVGACLGVLAGGHPRAVEVLLTSIEASRDGEPFLGKLLSQLHPTRLSLQRPVTCRWPGSGLSCVRSRR